MWKTALHWCCAHLACVLLLVERRVSSSPSPEVVVCNVGGRALLPCSWKDVPPAASPHVAWASRTPVETVYEAWGSGAWSAPEYRGRAEIPEERLATGDCSLVLRDVQLLDGGVYDSYGMRGEGRGASKVFVRSVRLSVRDHKLQRSVGVGEDLVLELHTPHAERVVFQERNGSAWGLLWLRGEVFPRVLKPPEREEVVLRETTPEDQGFYKVLDRHGLAVSTLRLSVHTEAQQNSPVESAAVGARTPGFAPLSLLTWLCVLALP